MGELEDILKSQKEKDTTLKKELGKRFRGEGEFDDMVFITTMGTPVNRVVAEREIHKIARDANEKEKNRAEIEQREPVVIPYVTPHIIRHTFATRCFEQEMDSKVVQKFMGHAYYSTTIDIYKHVVGGKMREESEKFMEL